MDVDRLFVIFPQYTTTTDLTTTEVLTVKLSSRGVAFIFESVPEVWDLVTLPHTVHFICQDVRLFLFSRRQAGSAGLRLRLNLAHLITLHLFVFGIFFFFFKENSWIPLWSVMVIDYLYCEALL